MFRIIAILCIIFYNALSQHNYEVEYYVNLITDAQNHGFIHELPKNASEYEANSPEKIEYGVYDFVIIGAGSTGTVVANRLSENPYWRILLIEAGKFGSHLTDVPNMYYPLEFSDYNWGYFSTPQKTACLGMIDKMCPYPRGKGVGGTTLINGLVYSRGHKSDFDKWAIIANDTQWSYENVLPYFKKSENFNHSDPNASVNASYHGKDGYLNVEYHSPRSPQLNAFLHANKEIGYNIVDYNANEIGASHAQINTKNGRRFDGGKAFIKPVLNRRNLRVLTNSYVMKININQDNTAYAVEFTKNKRNYIVRVSKEVILSAGAISSPQLLMLSGIGPASHLDELGIPLIQDLEVGSSLLDHPNFFGLNFGTTYTEPIKPLNEYVKEFLNGTGPLSAPGNNQGVGFYPSKNSKSSGIPDFEIMMIPANATADLTQKGLYLTNQTYEDVFGKTKRTQSFILYLAVLHTKSKGTIRLKSNNAFDFPIIDSKLLSDPEDHDISLMYEALQMGLKLIKTRAFQKINAKLQGGPLRACNKRKYLTKEYWYCAFRHVSLNLYHPVGSCPMGSDPAEGAVVDSELKVFGVNKLRVADASVFPLTLAGHPNAPAIMVGDKVSDLIKNSYNV